MAKRKIHLVSNAHLDPVWLWEWQEGAGEALSTFRQAAEFCEETEGLRLLPQRGRPLRVGRGVRAGALRADPRARPGGKVARHGRLVRPARLQHAERRVVRPPDPARPELLRDRSSGVDAADGRQPRPLRPHPRPRPDPGQERLHGLPLLPPRQQGVPPAPRRVRLGRLRRLRGPGHPGLGPLLFGRRQGARAAGEVARGESRRAIPSSISGASATTAAARRARTWPTSKR